MSTSPEAAHRALVQTGEPVAVACAEVWAALREVISGTENNTHDEIEHTVNAVLLAGRAAQAAARTDPG